MSDKTVRVGIIGCGALGAIHAARLSAMPGVRVTAVCDPHAPSADRVAASLDGSARTLPTDLDVIASGVDAVCIASPDGQHVRQALAALARGIHVLCEKPLTLDPADLSAIIAAVERSGCVMTMTYPRRHEDRLRRMRAEILSGRWGRVVAASLYNTEEWVKANAGTWRHDPAQCPGGFFYDANGHQVDTFFWLTGERAEWVEAGAENHGTPSPMAAWGAARLAGGAPLTFHFVGIGPTWREQINIQCEGAYFVIDNGRPQWWHDGTSEPFEDDGPREHADDVLIRLIRGGADNVNWAHPADLWPVLNFTRSALISAAEGRRVTVPAGPPVG